MDKLNCLVSNPKEQILQFIKNNPSTHLRKIKASLNYSMGTIQYHLKNLEKEGKITSNRNGFYKNFYHIQTKEMNNTLMSALNLESQRKIILYLLEHDPSTNSELSSGIGLGSSTVSWHTKRLVKSGIIELKYNGKFSNFSLRNKKEIIPLLNQYSDSTWNTMISNMAVMFTAFHE